MGEIFSFGEWVRRRRKALDLTQDALARQVGCALSMVRKIESDERRPSRQIAELLVDALAVPESERDQFLRTARAELAPDRLAPPAAAILDRGQDLYGRSSEAAAPQRPPPRPGNLPSLLTSFVGREREIAESASLLEQTRLVTLIGPGGTGKTRLSLQLAELMLADTARFPDGIWLVELAPVADPALVPRAVADALDVREERGQPLLATLAEILRSRQLLLLLDNCEHVIEAAAGLAEALLRSCPHMRVLASSREALGVPGEQVWRVPPLALPDDPGDTLDLEALGRSEAVQLFVARAQAGRPGFQLDAHSARAVAQICRRLDGIPLAIELAAARMRHMPVEQIVARLNDRFRLLTGGARTALPRHQTLRALIDWSYDLLEEGDRAMLCSLAVFAGGWSLEAAVAVVEGSDESAVLDGLSRLVDRSLVVTEEQGGVMRYSMLETIRQYAAERLAASDVADAVRRRHAQHYLTIAKQAEAELGRRQHLVWIERLDHESDNMRAALGWSLGGGDAALGIELACSLAGGANLEVGYWLARGRNAEARIWLQQAWGRSAAESATLRARILNHLGELGFSVGDMEGAARSHAESLALVTHAVESAERAQIFFQCARLAWVHGDYPQAEQLTQEALRTFRTRGNRHHIAAALHSLGDIARDRGDLAQGEALLEQALAIHKELGNVSGYAESVTQLGEVSYLQRNTTLARSAGAAPVT